MGWGSKGFFFPHPLWNKLMPFILINENSELLQSFIHWRNLNLYIYVSDLYIKWAHLSVDIFHILKSKFYYNQNCGSALLGVVKRIFFLEKRFLYRYCSLAFNSDLLCLIDVSQCPKTETPIAYCCCPQWSRKNRLWPTTQASQSKLSY